MILYMLDGLPTWTAHLNYQEVWAGPSWSSTALRYDVAFIWSINLFYHTGELLQQTVCWLETQLAPLLCFSATCALPAFMT
jgi:hypothetical protein